MLARLREHPLWIALLIGLAAELLFAFHLGQPSRLMFDETHYVPAARVLLALDRPVNMEHPLLGKTLIATGIAIFGDNPTGWRAMSTLAGSATVVGVFAFLMLLLGRIRPAVTGALLTAINQLVFIQARIGMLDVFLGMLVIWGIVALLWAMRAPPGKVVPRWILGSALLGLAVGVKWLAAPYVAFAGIAFLAVRRADRGKARWQGLRTIPALALLGGVSIGAYFLTFLPAFFYANDAMTLGRLIPFQREMWALQTQILKPHPYQSSWWSWPLVLRPIWYFYEPDMGAQRGVLFVGNPVVMWSGLVAVAACYVAWVRDRARAPLAVALLWTASLAVWAVIPKSIGFYYYYYLSSIFLCAVIAVAFDRYDRDGTKDWENWFVGGALFAFFYFYPILAANALPEPQAFNNWMWFDSWR